MSNKFKDIDIKIVYITFLVLWWILKIFIQKNQSRSKVIQKCFIYYIGYVTVKKLR